MNERPSCLSTIPALLLLLALALISPDSGSLLAAEGEDTEAEAEYSRGSRMCLACHGEGRKQAAHEILLSRMAVTADSRTPMADENHGCESCHGPSKAHTRRA